MFSRVVALSPLSGVCNRSVPLVLCLPFHQDQAAQAGGVS